MARRAFTLIELLIVIAIIAVLISILLPALGDARRSGKLAICSTNMKQMGTAAFGYASDHEDRIPNFNWRAGMQSANADSDIERHLRGIHSDSDGAMLQAVQLVRDFNGHDINIPRDKGLGFPYPHLTNLVLSNYLSDHQPDKGVVCPEDTWRLLYQTETVDFRDHFSVLPLEAKVSQRQMEGDLFPYSTSYEVSAATYDKFQSRITNVLRGARVGQFRSHRKWAANQTSALGVKITMEKVAFPSQKVFFMDLYQRHFGKDMFYAHPEARQPLLAFDGNVNTRQTADSNQGWDPRRDESDPDPTRFDYEPEEWEAPLRTGGWDGAEEVQGYYRWTRGGLRGIDFGGEEISTGQPRN